MAGTLSFASCPADGAEVTVSPSSGEIKGFGDSEILRLGQELGRDTKYIVTAPMRIDRKNALILGGAAVAISGLMFVDDDIQDFFQRNRTSTLDDIADTLDTLGSAGTLFLGNMGLVGTGLWFRKHKTGDKLLRAALVSTEAQLFAEGISALAKFAIGRNRPNEGQGKGSFNLFHDFDRSFPSSHAARSFAVAAVFADRYEQPIPFMAYTAATLVSLSGVYLDEHFASDVLAGAILGFALGKVLSRRHREPDSGWSLLPLVTDDRGGVGLGVRCLF
jgi:membrane-associated phospholipid phosphatase